MEFSGPTFFEPILENAVQAFRNCSKRNPYHYSVLLILTDGVIHDMEETIQLLVENSGDVGLSVIVVGIGDSDFSEMHRLDGDN